MKSVKGTGLVLFLLIFCGGSALAQVNDYSLKYDTSYITAYKDELTSRLFLSRKQNGLNLTHSALNPWIRYRTNDKLMLGMGYTYSFFNFNLAVKLPFINVDDDIYGESRSIDIQAHTIFRSIIVDYYLQWNKGFYIANPEEVYPARRVDAVKPYRGDLRSSLLNINVQYLFNSRKYSYKAAFYQNEFQKKSAGSPLVGMDASWLLVMSDSAMIDDGIPPSGYLDDQPFNQADAMSLGVNGGYAYTFVWKETFYLSLSTSFGLSIGENLVHNSRTYNTLHSKFTVGLSNSSRISMGFNTRNYYVGLSFIHYSLTNRLGNNTDWLGYNTGNIRFNIVKRFITRRPIKALRPDLWNIE